MRNNSYEQKKVDQVTQLISNARETFRQNGIDINSRQMVAQAAAATSTPVDELLAVMEMRERRALRRRAPQREVTPEVAHTENGVAIEEHPELVA